MELERNRYWTMDLVDERSTIDLVWTDATSNMAADDFKGALERFAGYAEQHHPKSLLVDVRRFGFTLAPELGEFRDKKIAPRYNGAGVQKFAYVFPPGVDTPPGAKNPGEDFETSYFKSTDDARAWLAL